MIILKHGIRGVTLLVSYPSSGSENFASKLLRRSDPQFYLIWEVLGISLWVKWSSVNMNGTFSEVNKDFLAYKLRGEFSYIG